mmetsp:Transcript_62358/g.117303  ORF Transcript_62358/g.117303 Transcript_62358/m.117303 type:complete len:292 (+) Transcript_62358:112-987(+)
MEMQGSWPGLPAILHNSFPNLATSEGSVAVGPRAATPRARAWWRACFLPSLTSGRQIPRRGTWLRVGPPAQACPPPCVQRGLPLGLGDGARLEQPSRLVPRAGQSLWGSVGRPAARSVKCGPRLAPRLLTVRPRATLGPSSALLRTPPVSPPGAPRPPPGLRAPYRPPPRRAAAWLSLLLAPLGRPPGAASGPPSCTRLPWPRRLRPKPFRPRAPAHILEFSHRRLPLHQWTITTPRAVAPLGTAAARPTPGFSVAQAAASGLVYLSLHSVAMAARPTTSTSACSVSSSVE